MNNLDTEMVTEDREIKLTISWSMEMNRPSVQMRQSHQLALPRPRSNIPSCWKFLFGNRSILHVHHSQSLQNQLYFEPLKEKSYITEDMVEDIVAEISKLAVGEKLALEKLP